MLLPSRGAWVGAGAAGDGVVVVTVVLKSDDFSVGIIFVVVVNVADNVDAGFDEDVDEDVDVDVDVLIVETVVVGDECVVVVVVAVVFVVAVVVVIAVVFVFVVDTIDITVVSGRVDSTLLAIHSETTAINNFNIFNRPSGNNLSVN